MNLPWTESIYFKKELEQRTLSIEERKLAQDFHDNGFVVLKNIFSSEELDQTKEALEKEYKYFYKKEGDRRVQDAWKQNNPAGKAVKNLATNPKVIAVLEMLYGRKALPFQTLNFKWGSEQKAHSDCIHFSSLPERFMTGVWVALENTSQENGTIFYYPKSHQLPVINMQHIISRLDAIPEEQSQTFYIKHYEGFMHDLMDFHNLKKVSQDFKKGDVVVWSANLVHGGGPIQNPNATRWTQVTHYYYQDCAYYTPLLSNIVTGDYQLNQLVNISNGQKMEHRYNGETLPLRNMENNLYNISKRVNSKLAKFDFITNSSLYKGLSRYKKKSK